MDGKTDERLGRMDRTARMLSPPQLMRLRAAHVMLFGLGGVLVEVLGDVTFRVPPFDRAEARRMLHEVRGFPLLAGARGRPKADLRALVDVLMNVQRLAVDHAG